MYMESGSSIDENTEAIVLRDKKYPKRGSKEWIISDDSIELHIAGKEKKKQTFLISDISQVRLLSYLTARALDINLTVDGQAVVVPLIVSDDVDAITKAYNHIADKNPNVPPMPSVTSVDSPVPVVTTNVIPDEVELPKNFIIHSRRALVLRDFIVGLALLFLALPISIADDVGSPNFIVGAGISLIGVIFTYNGIYSSFWKCTVYGDMIKYRSLFRQKIIAFNDVKYIAPKYRVGLHRFWGSTGGFVGIDLFSENDKLFHIDVTKNGFRAFVARLEEHGIHGVDKLHTGNSWR